MFLGRNLSLQCGKLTHHFGSTKIDGWSSWVFLEKSSLSDFDHLRISWKSQQNLWLLFERQELRKKGAVPPVGMGPPKEVPWIFTSRRSRFGCECREIREVIVLRNVRWNVGRCKRYCHICKDVISMWTRWTSGVIKETVFLASYVHPVGTASFFCSYFVSFWAEVSFFFFNSLFQMLFLFAVSHQESPGKKQSTRLST